MLDCPEGRNILHTWAAAGFPLVVFPFFLLFLMSDSWQEVQLRALFGLILRGATFLAVLFGMWQYLKDSFLQVQLQTKKCLTTAALCVGLMAAVYVGLAALAMVLQTQGLGRAVMWMLPLCEHESPIIPPLVVWQYPVLGTLCMTLCAPLSISGLYYACGFAPMATRHPKMAYLTVCLILFVPRVINLLLFQSLAQELTLYLSQLPIHLIACWGYRKTDTVYTPIAALMGINLLGSLAAMLLGGMMM